MNFSTVLPGVSVGDTFGPVAFVVTPELNEQYLFAMRDFDPRYLGNGAPALVHPAVLLNASMTWLLNFKPAPEWVGLHSRDDIEWEEPVYVDEPLQITYRVVELLEKRGRPWWVREVVIRGDEGRTRLVRRVHTAFARRSDR